MAGKPEKANKKELVLICMADVVPTAKSGKKCAPKGSKSGKKK